MPTHRPIYFNFEVLSSDISPPDHQTNIIRNLTFITTWLPIFRQLFVFAKIWCIKFKCGKSYKALVKIKYPMLGISWIFYEPKFMAQAKTNNRPRMLGGLLEYLVKLLRATWFWSRSTCLTLNVHNVNTCKLPYKSCMKITLLLLNYLGSYLWPVVVLDDI